MKQSRTKNEAMLRLLHRLLMSHYDFQQASWIAGYILDHKLQDKVDRLRGKRRYRIKLLWQALNHAMIIAYCRPFSGNDRRAAKHIPDLPVRFLKLLTTEEKEIHNIAMEDRNKLLAHSDSDAWNLRPFFMEMAPGRKTLLPLHHDVRAPLVHDAVACLKSSCDKLMESVLQERMQLENELANVLPTVSVDGLNEETTHGKS